MVGDILWRVSAVEHTQLLGQTGHPQVKGAVAATAGVLG
jgi:hypothetical protein